MKAIHRTLVTGGLLSVASALMPGVALGQRSGVQIWAETCGNCHTAQPAARYTADQWASIIVQMKITARMTDDDADAVLQFLQGGAKRVASAASAPVVAEDNWQPVQLASVDTAHLGWGTAAADAAKNFAGLCAPCHGSAGAGDGPVAAALDPRPTDLTDAEFLASRSDAELETAIGKGIRTMPGFENQITAEQIHALVTYIRGLGKGGN